MDRPWSDEEIATLAEKVREYAGVSPSQKLNVARLVQQLQENSNRLARVAFIPAVEDDLKNSLARAEPKRRLVRYRPILMDRLNQGNPDAAEVALEEIGHVLMHSSSPSLDHAVGVDVRALNIPSVREKEREAQKFVWYTLAPISEVYGVCDSLFLSQKFGLTLASAEQYVEHIRRTKNKIEKTGRSLPAGVIDYLAEAQKRGHSIRRTDISRFPAIKGNASIAMSSKPLEHSSVLSEGPRAFLAETCRNCGQRKLRMLGGCKQCFGCGEDNGCD